MLNRLFRSAPEATEVRGAATAWGAWPGEASATYSGVDVTPDSALQLLTVYGCVRLITDSISTLPIDTYRRTADDGHVDIPKPSWLTRPTTDLDFTSWCTQVLASLLLHGNAYLAVFRSSERGIGELIPLDPSLVVVGREKGRKVFYVGGSIYDGEILHIKGLMLPGVDIGLSPIEYARQSIGLGMAAMQHGARYLKTDGNMPGVIEIPGAAQPEQMKAMAELWRRKRTTAGAGLPGVLEGGATWKPTGVTHEQMQFLQTRRYESAAIAGQLFMVDPSELGIGVDGTSLTYANLEQRNTRFVRVTLLPWIVRIEQALSDLMLNPRYMKFNVNALLRGDLTARYTAYATGIQAGFLEPNEARDWEELPPLAATAPNQEVPA